MRQHIFGHFGHYVCDGTAALLEVEHELVDAYPLPVLKQFKQWFPANADALVDGSWALLGVFDKIEIGCLGEGLKHAVVSFG